MSRIGDLDAEDHDRVTELLERADRFDSRCPAFAARSRQEAAEVAGVDDPDALERTAVDPDPGTIEALREDYLLEDLTDADNLEAEIERVEAAKSAMEGRCPDHHSALVETLEALHAVREAVGTRYVDSSSSWDALASATGLDGEKTTTVADRLADD